MHYSCVKMVLFCTYMYFLTFRGTHFYFSRLSSVTTEYSNIWISHLHFRILKVKQEKKSGREAHFQASLKDSQVKMIVNLELRLCSDTWTHTVWLLIFLIGTYVIVTLNSVVVILPGWNKKHTGMNFQSHFAVTVLTDLYLDPN